MALAAFSGLQQQIHAQGQPRPQEPVIAIEGLDAVLLVQGKEAQGKENIAITRGNFKYIFATEENKAAFEKEPERYAVQLNGACARMGPGSRGNPDLWAVHDGKIYLFASDDCQRAFKANPAKFFEPRIEPLTVTPESAARAKALLAKAVDAMGGAAKVDGVTSLQLAGTWPGNNADGEFPQSLTVVFPDRVRFDQSAVANGVSATLSFVVSPADSFVHMIRGDRRQTFRMLPPTQAERMKAVKRHPLWVLRARNTPGFVATATGTGKVGERAVELVTAEFDGLRVTLAIEPVNGQVLRLSYLDRGPDGFGIFDESFSDFRAVDGLTLPLATAATIDGKQNPQRCFKGQTLVVNAALAPDLFQRPATQTPPQP